MTRYRIIAISLLLSLISAGIWLGVTWLREPPIRPVTDMPRGVHYSDGDQWFTFYQEDAPPGTGWVHLPKPGDMEEYRSGVDPFLLGYVQPHVCGECHSSEYEGFLETAHFRTSSIATRETVLGDFSPDGNRLTTKDPNLHFEMFAEGDSLYQSVFVEQDGRTYEHRASFDLVTGSGNHGQTYLYWDNDRLCQLPISYFSESDWINSPGNYRDGTADFARGVGARCLDCHATFFGSHPSEFNRHDRSNFILGVTCVRCHGPGWAHVQYHRGNPEAEEARYIVNPSQLEQVRADESTPSAIQVSGDPCSARFHIDPANRLKSSWSWT